MRICSIEAVSILSGAVNISTVCGGVDKGSRRSMRRKDARSTWQWACMGWVSPSILQNPVDSKGVHDDGSRRDMCGYGSKDDYPARSLVARVIVGATEWKQSGGFPRHGTLACLAATLPNIHVGG